VTAAVRELGTATDPDTTRERLLACSALTAAVVALSRVPILQFPGWPAVALAFTVAIVCWGGWPFHRGAWGALRRAEATRDGLLSIALLAAFGWAAGLTGARAMDVAAVLVVIALAVRYVEGCAPAQLGRHTDRVTAVAGPVAVAAAVGVLGFRIGSGAAVADAVTAAVAVVVVAGPCSCGIAGPVAWHAAKARGRRLGVRLIDPTAPEVARRVDTLVLCGTAMITAGVLRVHAVRAVDADCQDAALRLAGAVEQESDHPIGRAIVTAASGHEPLPAVAEFDAVAGRGVRGIVAEVVTRDDGVARVVAHAVLVGGTRMLAEHDIALPSELAAARADAAAEGQRSVVVAWDGVARAVITLACAVPASAARTVRKLHRRGIAPVLLTAEASPFALSVAQEAGIPGDAVIAELAPGDHPVRVRRLRADGRVVAVVGAERAPGLATADLGLAVVEQHPPDVGVELARPGLPLVVTALRLARRTAAVSRTGAGLSLAATAVALPLAVIGLMGPAAAVALTGCVAACVAAQSLRVRWIGTTRG
jgi:P-type Cu+ transporter